MNGNPTYSRQHRRTAMLAFENREIFDACGPLDVFAGTDGLIEEDWGKDIAVLVAHGRRLYEYRESA